MSVYKPGETASILQAGHLYAKHCYKRIYLKEIYEQFKVPPAENCKCFDNFKTNFVACYYVSKEEFYVSYKEF
jgi:hypothetical protein